MLPRAVPRPPPASLAVAPGVPAPLRNPGLARGVGRAAPAAGVHAPRSCASLDRVGEQAHIGSAASPGHVAQHALRSASARRAAPMRPAPRGRPLCRGVPDLHAFTARARWPAKASKHCFESYGRGRVGAGAGAGFPAS